MAACAPTLIEQTRTTPQEDADNPSKQYITERIQPELSTTESSKTESLLPAITDQEPYERNSSSSVFTLITVS